MMLADGVSASAGGGDFSREESHASPHLGIPVTIRAYTVPAGGAGTVNHNWWSIEHK
jgi:hypothetical protein